jgi:methylenetetrahydrofolate dehydrogenase (NADP+)/methenyltetrahydrofolate cyclohydrolase
LIQTISPEKDVDGLRGDWQKLSHTQTSLAALSAPSPYAMPPMVNSVVSLLDHYQISLTDKKIVLVGEGRLAGGPLLTYFKKLDLDVVAVNEESEQILAISKEADILISATGVDNLITYQWVKEGAVVIDCAADIHEDSVVQVASALAPAKGGVGPLTVAWLLHNTVQASIQSRRNHG